jgi:hypothetical protein
MRNRKLTFESILADVEKSNLDLLMNRARTANRLAKVASDSAMRRGAYRVKHNALHAIEAHFPERVRVSKDPQYGTFFFSVKVTGSRFALHAPATRFNVRPA